MVFSWRSCDFLPGVALAKIGARKKSFYDFIKLLTQIERFSK